MLFALRMASGLRQPSFISSILSVLISLSPKFKRAFSREGLPRGDHSNSLPAHISSHCVANFPRSRKRSDPGKLQGGAYRILYETRSGFRRLFRPGDDVHPDRVQPRRQSKTLPRREEIPSIYHGLLDWYEAWSQNSDHVATIASIEDDPLLRLRGSGTSHLGGRACRRIRRKSA